MLEPAMFVGLGAVALWMHLRFPCLRPRSFVRAAAHVAISFVGFALLPTMLGIVLPFTASHSMHLSVALGVLVPAMTYLLLSWIWLVARLLDELLGGTPRGGHPVAS